MKQLILVSALFASMSAFACGNNNLCPGEKVINDNGLTGVISAVFPSGEVAVKFDGYTTFNKWPVERLAVTSGCAQKDAYCVGKKVINDNGLRGTIGGVFQDGEVAVKYDGYTSYNKWPLNRLARTEGCSEDNYCVANIVINDKGLSGIVTGVYLDGEVAVRYDGYTTNNKWPTQRLAYTTGCSSDNYCVNDVIINDNGLAGSVTGVYKDGEVAVKYNGYTTNNKWPTNRLAVTDACADRSIIRSTIE
jgi:hypothetical protein